LNLTEKEITNQFSFRKVIIPVLIGLLVAGYMLYNNLTEVTYQKVEDGKGQYEWVDGNQNEVIDINSSEDFHLSENGNYELITYSDALKKISFSFYFFVWISVALLMVVLRVFAYILRLKILTSGDLSWKQCFRVIVLWEFSSAITPSVVGGAAPAVYFISREKIPVGKASAIVMITALLDELFYVIMVPLIILFIGTKNLFPVSLEKEVFGVVLGTKGIFIAGYSFILILISIIIYAIFINPKTFRRILAGIFKIGFLKRWRRGAIQAGDDIIITSREMKDKPFSYWVKAFGATFLSWTARFWVVNFLILSINPDLTQHLLVYGRQLVMWVILLISPTPGSSGVAEFAFSGFLSDFIPPLLVGSLAIIWRLLSFYIYIFAGAIILPRWLRATSKKRTSVQ
jgi:uncharacterized protein (TIRG00374 family)